MVSWGLSCTWGLSPALALSGIYLPVRLYIFICALGRTAARQTLPLEKEVSDGPRGLRLGVEDLSGKKY